MTDVFCVWVLFRCDIDDNTFDSFRKWQENKSYANALIEYTIYRKCDVCSRCISGASKRKLNPLWILEAHMTCHLSWSVIMSR